MQNAQEELSAAAAAAVVREAAASAVMDVLEGESAEEKACKLAAAKEERMRKVIRSVISKSLGAVIVCMRHCRIKGLAMQQALSRAFKKPFNGNGWCA